MEQFGRDLETDTTTFLQQSDREVRKFHTAPPDKQIVRNRKEEFKKKVR